MISIEIKNLYVGEERAECVVYNLNDLEKEQNSPSTPKGSNQKKNQRKGKF